MRYSFYLKCTYCKIQNIWSQCIPLDVSHKYLNPVSHWHAILVTPLSPGPFRNVYFHLHVFSNAMDKVRLIIHHKRTGPVNCND